ncbi:hypothetical protein PPERSA_00536 [Pseudocohnilembus persalinus]|uniref:Uncharacterized protein n=1 Tax=Pseudocohnilembus persalinus TaxID=266149 RepID=A0A0V0QI02_PSEPJ|nr:hypothetical protein PPERSA_00536 [Pseudocohnilembus persalinus]|eukprot:KRX01826.1 hypothetical protein PPERSA_00536 [Pseudocohnilembus persalinus]
MQQKKSCQKANHNLEYQCVNWTDKIDQLLLCSKCVIGDDEPVFRKILISDILNEDYKESQIQNWPPLQDKNQSRFVNSVFQCSEQYPSEENVFNNLIQLQIENFFKDQELKICSRLNQIKKDVKIKFETYTYEFYEQNKTNGKINIEQIIKNFKINDFRTKMKEFLDNKISIDQFFQFQQAKNEEFVNKYGKDIDEQFTKQSEIQEQFQRLKDNIDKSLQEINGYVFFIKKEIDLKFHKSNFQGINNSFTIAPDNKKISFNNQYVGYYKQVYSDILEKQQTYHIKIRIDAKGSMQNQSFYFGVNSQQNVDQQLYNTNYLYAFHQNANSSGSKNFKKEGQYNRFNQFFKDNQTILNILFNISKQQFEMFDDQNYLKCSIELQDIDEPIFYIVNHQTSSVQNDLYIDSVITY